MNKYQRIAGLIPSQEQERVIRADAVLKVEKETQTALAEARKTYRRRSKKVLENAEAPAEDVQKTSAARRRLPKREVSE